MLENMMVRFECGQENRWSEEYGPFPFVQITYSDLRVGPDGEPLAQYSGGHWYRDDDPDARYSDVIIYPALASYTNFEEGKDVG